MRCAQISNVFPLMLLACSVDTPIHINRSYLLASRCVLHPVWIGPYLGPFSKLLEIVQWGIGIGSLALLPFVVTRAQWCSRRLVL